MGRTLGPPRYLRSHFQKSHWRELPQCANSAQHSPSETKIKKRYVFFYGPALDPGLSGRVRRAHPRRVWGRVCPPRWAVVRFCKSRQYFPPVCHRQGGNSPRFCKLVPRALVVACVRACRPPCLRPPSQQTGRATTPVSNLGKFASGRDAGYAPISCEVDPNGTLGLSKAAAWEAVVLENTQTRI